MYTDHKPFGLAFQTGNFVNTPIDEIGYIHAMRDYGVLVRCPGPGRDDKRCITPKASVSALWVFQPQDLSLYVQPQNSETTETEAECEPSQA